MLDTHKSIAFLRGNVARLFSVASTVAVFVGVAALVLSARQPAVPSALKQTGGKGAVVIKAGDLLNTDLSAKGFGSHGDDVVDPLGNTLNMHNDKVHVAGLTVPQAEEAMKQSIPDVDVVSLHITIKCHNMISVAVMGAQNVQVNGFFTLHRNARLSDALRLAKPLPGVHLNSVEVWQISSRNPAAHATVSFANYAAFLAHKNPSGNPIMQNGAIIEIGPIYGGNAP